MLLAHALALAEARSCIAALADRAHTVDGSVEYDRVLLHLDALYGGDIPALGEVAVDDPSVLYDAAENWLVELVGHGVDSLQVELLLAMLEGARAADEP
jgi:hypothetical protein